MANNEPFRTDTIAAFHQYRGMAKPEHPLISVVNVKDMVYLGPREPRSLINGFYSIALKRNFNGKMRYGQQQYDFDEGVMLFMAPGQVFSIETDGPPQHSGYLLLIHPDFFWNKPLAKKISQYEFFNYSVHEALHLSEKEEALILGIIQQIENEYRSSIDEFSQDVILAQLEVLLTYAERFYRRQFITRKITNHRMLERFNELLAAYFADERLSVQGLPTVQYFGDAMNVSPGYLGSVLKMLTGMSTQQHIHEKLIERAKLQLSTTALSVSEIAYALGFEHSQSFSKLFKAKTRLSPQDFRRSFN